MQIIKRDGSKCEFSCKKIVQAILKANNDVEENERVAKDSAELIANCIQNDLITTSQKANVEKIQDMVVEYLMRLGRYKLAVEYTIYRYKRELIREVKSTDENILSLINGTNTYCMEENSNKNPINANTQRDYIAGEVSKDLTKRVLLPKRIVKAHEDGLLHFHDMDYYLQPIFNCCLINIKDMLENGTALNGKLIETPKSFRVACTVMTQIIAAVASGQYGGQSVNLQGLGKFLYMTYEKFKKSRMERWENSGILDALKDTGRDVDSIIAFNTMEELKKELSAGVQTIQYQVNSLMTTNGQAPFITMFMILDKEDPYLEWTAMLYDEILEQRIAGIKDTAGNTITTAFPKLIYVLDECNCLQGGEYDWLTKKAIRCSAKRMYPDYISAKKMREEYNGQVFSCMGCRSFLSPWKDADGNYKFEGRFNQGVVTINLPRVALDSKGDMSRFWELLDERLELCFEALMCRHKALEGTLSDISPIHWQHGAIARLQPGEPIDALLHGGYSSISLGYIGIYEMTRSMLGVSHTTEKGKEFALSVLEYLEKKCEEWKKETNVGFSLYGTPAESLCYRFAEIDRSIHGSIKNVTDVPYYTNSYHVNVREPIDAFSKLQFEQQFQSHSLGGAISYVEIPNMTHNLEALEELIKFIYNNIRYAEVNTREDVCDSCGFVGEMQLTEHNEWYCPNCNCTDKNKLHVTRRTCGYLGEHFWNVGKTQEIKDRLLHL